MKRHSVSLSIRKMPNPVREASYPLAWQFPRDKRQQVLAKSVEGAPYTLWGSGDVDWHRLHGKQRGGASKSLT